MTGPRTSGISDITGVTTAPTALRVRVGADELAVDHYAAVDDRLAGAAGRPVAVMAHGLAGTKDSGLAPFATALAAAGLDVLALDYRGFGESGGTPRQQVVVARQQEDYRAVVAHARTLPGLDPDRVVLWGVSLAGGHVLTVAADDPRVAAVVSLTPLVDGVAAGRHALATHRPVDMLRTTGRGIASRLSQARGRAARTMAVVGAPGEPAALTVPGAREDYLAIAGPSWRNEIDAAVGLELGAVRAHKDAARVACPTLVQIADLDRSAPPHAAALAAFAARAVVHHVPGDHFDVWPGKPWHATVVAQQVRFVTRTLGPA